MSSDRSLSAQVWILILACLLWAVWPVTELWAWILAYGVAWLAWQLLGRRKKEIPRLSEPWLAVVGALALLPVIHVLRHTDDLLRHEELWGLQAHTTDRLRLETLPALAPPLLTTDRPQTFYAYAPGADRFQLILGKQGPELDGRSVGEGLFTIAYDPKVHGKPAGQDARQRVYLETDDGRSARHLTRVDPEPHPRWFCGDPWSGWAATPSEETDEIFLFFRDGRTSRLATADGPTDCAVLDGEGGKLLAVSHRFDDELWLFAVDADGGFERVDPIGIGPSQVGLSAVGSILAVAVADTRPRVVFMDVTAVDGATRAMAGSIDLENPPDRIEFLGPDDLAVADRHDRTLSRWTRDRWTQDGQAWRERGRLELGRPVVTMARSHGGDRLFVAVTDYRPDGEDHRGNHFIQDQILTVKVESWQVVRQYVTGRRTELQSYPGSIDSGASPMGLAHRPDGTLLITFAGSEELWQIDDGFQMPPEVLRGTDLDLIAPHGVADLGDGVWVASSPAGGAVATYDRTGLREFHGLARSDDELLAEPVGSVGRRNLTLRRGERGFYETTRTGIACQSCHLHGDSDHSPHDIGQTPLLPTLTIRGVTGTSPYLRDGSFPQIRDLHPGLADSLLRGYRRFSESRPLDLERWVESTARLPHPEHFQAQDGWVGPDPVALARGWQVFRRAQCHLCHGPPAFTNLSAHPVRSLFPEYGRGLSPTSQVDTPSLIGIHGKGHWLQDGRAHSLEDVLVEHNRFNRHGNTAGLTEREIADLAAFLRML